MKKSSAKKPKHTCSSSYFFFPSFFPTPLSLSGPWVRVDPRWNIPNTRDDNGHYRKSTYTHKNKVFGSCCCCCLPNAPSFHLYIHIHIGLYELILYDTHRAPAATANQKRNRLAYSCAAECEAWPANCVYFFFSPHHTGLQKTQKRGTQFLFVVGGFIFWSNVEGILRCDSFELFVSTALRVTTLAMVMVVSKDGLSLEKVTTPTAWSIE